MGSLGPMLHSRHCHHRRHQRQAGNVGGSRVEPFVGRLFPWRNCHGGAWNKILLMTHTRVRNEWDQQHGSAAKSESGFRMLGISMDIPRYTKYIPCIYIKWYTKYIHGYTMYILSRYTWYIQGYTTMQYIQSDGLGYTWYNQGYHQQTGGYHFILFYFPLLYVLNHY